MFTELSLILRNWNSIFFLLFLCSNWMTLTLCESHLTFIFPLLRVRTTLPVYAQHTSVDSNRVEIYHPSKCRSHCDPSNQPLHEYLDEKFQWVSQQKKKQYYNDIIYLAGENRSVDAHNLFQFIVTCRQKIVRITAMEILIYSWKISYE